MARRESKPGLIARWLLPLLMLAVAQADTFEVDYQSPASGAALLVSAPDPATTPIVIELVIDGKRNTAAVLGNGLWRYKSIIADASKHPKVAQNPKARALPSEAELLVPVDKNILLIARSHAELVGSNIQTCTIPFTFKPREGFRYVARWKVTQDGCLFGVFEKALEPADAAETPLTSLEQAGAAK